MSVGAAVELLRSRAPEGFPTPEAYLVLGSGLGGLVDRVESAASVPFADVPGFPSTGVQGHRGAFVLGYLGGRAVLVQAGRVHLYEGHPVQTVVAGVRIAHGLGASIGVFTNAAGGIDRTLRPGDLLVIDDQINLTGHSALAGPVQGGEDRFPDMSAPYDPELQALALQEGLKQGVALRRGVYLGLLGPSFETPAEIRMAAGFGAHAVGMSTVLEVTTARAVGMRCLGISMITNPAAGLSSQPLSHEEVLATGAEAGRRLGSVLEALLPLL